MRRALCVWLPTFSTDLVKRRLARQASAESVDREARRRRVVILTRSVGSRELVVRRCEAAAAAGVIEGMDLVHARSLLASHAELHTEMHRPDRDAAALHSLACWALRFSPLVAPDPPDGLLIDITGTERVHRGEVRLIRAAAGGVVRLGFRVRVATAPTFGCAWGISRFGAHDLSRVPPGNQRKAIGELPVASLRLDEKIVMGLSEIGITQVGHLLALPRASLASRFDELLIRRLCQALGEAGKQIEPVRPKPPLQVEMIFDGPTDRWESVEAAARQVLDELVAQLSQRECGARRLDMQLRRPYAEAVGITIHLSRPSRGVKHLWSLLRSQLEHVDVDAGIEGIVLTASRTARVRHEQSGSAAMGSEERPPPGAWNELTDTLAGRLGVNNVVHIEPVESHLPERAFRERSVMDAAASSAASVTGADRPTVLFERPEPADAMALTPDGPLLSLGWRDRRWDVVACAGPERIGQEWWRWAPLEEKPKSRGRSKIALAPPDRDYFKVQTRCGRWLWIFRHVETSRWFVHGEWS